MSSIYDINDYKLGETDNLLKLESQAENILVINHMVKQCTRSLHIINRKLEPRILGTAEFTEAVKQLVIQNSYARVRIIIFDIDIIIRHSNRLLDLSTKLSSFIDLRKAHPSCSEYNESLMVADETGYVYRDNSERYEGKASFKDYRLCHDFLKQFTTMWDTASPDQNLRKMTL